MVKIGSTCGGSSTVCVTYDAFGQIAEKQVGSVYKQILYSPLGKTAVMNGQTLVNTYLPLPGGATLYETPGAKNFWHNDWLGTARLSSTSAHAIVYDRAFAPFGEPYSTFGTAAAGLSFTGDTQDTFIVNGSTPEPYDTPDRELHPIQGRWLSPDPAGLAAVDPTNPQTWNRYAYVGNNPLAFVDPSGDVYPGGVVPNCQPTVYLGANAAVSGGYAPNSATICPFSVIVTPPCSFAGVSTAPCDPSMPQPMTAGGNPGNTGNTGSGPASNGPKQTFSQCMAANSSTFSLAGVAQGAVNGALSQFGTSVNFKDAWWAKVLGGNAISGTLFGSPGDAGVSAATATPGILVKAMGTGITFGRRTSTIMALNLAGKGGLPQALSSATGGLKSMLGTADSVLSLGLDFTTKLEIDAALSASEAAYCAYKTR